MGSSRPLQDAPDRSYASKLDRFARFAAQEMRGVFAQLGLPPRATMLDLGCGTAFASACLADYAGDDGYVVALDLSLPHLNAARANYRGPLVQGDAGRLCFRDGVFDLIWSCNTINHVAEPVEALAALRPLLRTDGRVALAQTGLVPEMFFAWDPALDDAVRAACHEYYRTRYGLSPGDLAGVRGLVRLLNLAGYARVGSRTVVIERTQPLSDSDRDYFQQAIFEGVWGAKIKPFLKPAEWQRLERNCDPSSPDYCLDRDDFHHIQTLTVCVGSA